ncbi:uncharacterized protein LOC100208165 isoform X2 [Hydra vulgaris]|uniref:Phosphomannomutase n=1 Tax=Hydra vulgaris TaxID=6087 RepID=A0ABM4CBZ8_HYDVU
MSKNEEIVCLFDVDGTLTESRKKISDEMHNFMLQLTKKVVVGLVGGSDLEKIKEQMGGERCMTDFDYVFAENGLVAYKGGELIYVQSFLKHYGEEKSQQIINFCLEYMSKLTLPCKRGTFIEYRNGLINVCPVGRSCSQEERNQFNKYDQEHLIRKKFAQAVEEKFSAYGLQCTIGGEISFDVFPIGWDKRCCLQHLDMTKIKEIHFFGDKVHKGGNDHEIYTDERVIGHQVTNANDTMEQLRSLFF